MSKPSCPDSYSQTFSIKLTMAQKEILVKNAWIKEELIKLVRDNIDMYLLPEQKRK